MSDSTLAQIKKKVRRLTASPSTNQLSEADLEEYIDTFFEQDLPASLKIWNLHDTLDFFTVANEDRYSFDTDLYNNVVPPVYIDGREVFYTQSREELFQIYPKYIFEQTASAGDGTAGPYTFTLTQLPVLKRQVTISVIDSSGVTETAYDVPQALVNNVGDLIDASDDSTVLGTVNYVTGAVTITWTDTVDTTENIISRTSPYIASRPSAILFFNNYFIIRPVPDKVYRVVTEVYKKPTQLLSANDHSDSNAPDIHQWWQYIALGAAIKILQDRQDIDGIQNIVPFFKEQENQIIYRTAEQFSSQRTSTIYTENVIFPGNRGGYGI